MGKHKFFNVATTRRNPLLRSRTDVNRKVILLIQSMFVYSKCWDSI